MNSSLGLRMGAGLLAAALAGSCASDPTQGYSMSSTFNAEGIKTIAIPIAENDSYVRGVEFHLTDALIKEVEARTPYRVTSRAEADSLLTAHIRKIELDSISKSRVTGLGEEDIVSVTIDFRWTDLSSLEDLVARQAFTGTGLFVPSRPVQERIELGRYVAVQELARDVVSEMQSAW